MCWGPSQAGPGLAQPFLPRGLPGHSTRHILSSLRNAGVPTLPLQQLGPHTPADPPALQLPPSLPDLPTAGPGPVLAVGTTGACSPPWHLPQLAGTRTGIRRRARSHASPRGMLFPTVSPPCYGVSVGTPLLRAGPLCGGSRRCRAVPATGTTPARPCPHQSPGEAASASAALTQLNPAQQHEMETRHPECQLRSKGRVGFRSLGVSFGPLSCSSSQPCCRPMLYHTRGATALGSGRPWG